MSNDDLTRFAEDLDLIPGSNSKKENSSITQTKVNPPPNKPIINKETIMDFERITISISKSDWEKLERLKFKRKMDLKDRSFSISLVFRDLLTHHLDEFVKKYE